MNIGSRVSTNIDWELWMQAIKYVTWGILAVVLTDMCTVTHSLHVLFAMTFCTTL